MPRATHVGNVKMGNVEIPCAVLEDGRRLLTQQGFLMALGRARSAKGGQGASVDQMPAFLAAKNIKPFIDSDLIASTADGVANSLFRAVDDRRKPAEVACALALKPRTYAYKGRYLSHGIKFSPSSYDYAGLELVKRWA